MENKNPIATAINTLTNQENRDNIIQQTKLIFSQNEVLQKCDANSVVLGIINLSNMGLDLSNTTNEAYFIPYGSKAQIQISYKGFEKLAYQTGKVKLIKCDTIYNLDYLKKEDNIFIYEEPKEDIFKEKGEPLGYIATLVFIDGMTFQEKMSMKEMKEFRKEYSKGNIWEKHWELMSHKTLIKKILRKYGRLINSPNLNSALQVDQSAYIDNEKIQYVDNENTIVPIKQAGETQEKFRKRLKETYLKANNLTEEEYNTKSTNAVNDLLDDLKQRRESKENEKQKDI